MAKMKKSEETKCWANVEQLRHLLPYWQGCNWYNHCGKLPISTKHEHTYTVTPNLYSGKYPTEMQTYTHQKRSTRMFIAAQFVIAPSWKPPKCPPTVKQVKKVW